MNKYLFSLVLGAWLIALPPSAAQPDQRRVDQLNQTAWELRNTHRDSALQLLQSALQLAERLDYGRGKSHSYNYRGLIYARRGQYAAAKTAYYRSLAERRRQDSVSLARVWNNLGALEQDQGTLDSAFYFLNLAAGIFERHAVDSSLASVYDNIANVYVRQKNWTAALRYYEKGIAQHQRYSRPRSLANAHFNLAGFYYDQADSAQTVHHALLARPLYEGLGDWKGEADILNLLGALYWEAADFPRAEDYFRSAIDIGTAHGDRGLGLVDQHRNLGGVYLEQEKVTEALAELRRAQALLAGRGNLYDQIDLREMLAEGFDLLGRYDSALHYQREIALLQDSMYATEKAEALAEMEVRFGKERMEHDLREERLRSRSLLQLFVGALVLALLILLFFFYRQRTNRIIARQRARIHEQELDDLLQTQELNMINAALEGQENERRRIAKDLHDRLGSLLTTIKWRMDDWLENTRREKDPDLHRTNRMLDEAYHEVRRIAHDMNSGVLAKFGLLPALEELRDSLTRSHSLRVELLTYGWQGRLDGTHEILIYRIIQELVSNILKHAAASRISIQVQRIGEQIQITVEDNGRGFDTEQVSPGMGLKNIEARVAGQEGRWEIDSGRGGGTTIFIDLPLGG